jgi:hypothetical protein
VSNLLPRKTGRDDDNPLQSFLHNLPLRESEDMIIDAGAGIFTGTETAGVLKDSMFAFDDLNSV